MQMISIIDYGIGNLGSIANMFDYIGVETEILSDPDKIYNAKKIIMPGVGSFDAAISKINNINGLREVLNYKALKVKIPFLGICLGMQLFVNSSEEGNLSGFGWIDGKVKKFPELKNLKVPHMGWNTVALKSSDIIVKNLTNQERYYFVHSYYVELKDKKNSLMKTNYGFDFDSGIFQENLYGFQFHPEKSHRYGMKIFKNFSEI
jgi:imidazole glycerol-phosphate synthase subunit HisH